MKELSYKDMFGKFLKDFLDKLDETLPNEEISDELFKKKVSLRTLFLDGCNKIKDEEKYNKTKR